MGLLFINTYSCFYFAPRGKSLSGFSIVFKVLFIPSAMAWKIILERYYRLLQIESNYFNMIRKSLRIQQVATINT